MKTKTITITITITIFTYGFLILAITGCTKNFDILKGEWIATTDNQNIYQTDGDENKIGGKEDYMLECDGKGSYILNLEDNKTKTGTYTISKDNKITFKDDNSMLIGICELSNDNELNCSEKSTYAFKYTKSSK